MDQYCKDIYIPNKCLKTYNHNYMKRYKDKNETVSILHSKNVTHCITVYNAQ